jgi:hypothetical protein
VPASSAGFTGGGEVAAVVAACKCIVRRDGAAVCVTLITCGPKLAQAKHKEPRAQLRRRQAVARRSGHCTNLSSCACRTRDPGSSDCIAASPAAVTPVSACGRRQSRAQRQSERHLSDRDH